MVHKSSYCKCSLVCMKWEPFFYFQSEHIPSKWENTRPDMQVLTEIKNPTIIRNVCKMVGQKSQKGEINTRIYVNKICAEGIYLCFFPWWLKIVKRGTNITSFQTSVISKFVFQNENNYIFKRILSQLQRKDLFLYVTIAFFLKQG